MDNGAVLSQDAIDALLNAVPDDGPPEAAPESEEAAPVEETVNVVEAPPLHPETDDLPDVIDDGGASALGVDIAPAAPSATAPVQQAAPVAQGNSAIPPAPVYQPLPPPPPLIPPPVVAQPGKGGVTREEAVEIAGEAAETSSAPLQAAVSRVTKRVDTLDLAIDRIAELEEEIERLKKRPEPKIDPRILQLFERLQALEGRARKSPVFGLYDKFTCSGCGHIGEAQVRVRCGHCAKDGWYGKKAKKDPSAEVEGEAGTGNPAHQPLPTDDTSVVLDIELGI